MARLWCVAVFLTAASFGAENPQISLRELSETVNKVRDNYAPSNTVSGPTFTPMFSLALSIPYNTENKKYDVNAVGDTDRPKTVKDDMVNCKVYTGTRVVAATVLKYPDATKQCPDERVPWDWVRNTCPDVQFWRDFTDKNKCSKKNIKNLKKTENELADHAEYRVFRNFDTTFNTLSQNDKETNLMLFYCKKTPCVYRCAKSRSPFNIVQYLPKMKVWSNFAYVFLDFYESNNAKNNTESLEEENRKSVKALGDVLGLNKVYRCLSGECFSCFSENANDQINVNCVK